MTYWNLYRERDPTHGKEYSIGIDLLAHLKHCSNVGYWVETGDRVRWSWCLSRDLTHPGNCRLAPTRAHNHGGFFKIAGNFFWSTNLRHPHRQHDKSSAVEMASRPTVTILSADGTASGATHPLPKVRRSRTCLRLRGLEKLQTMEKWRNWADWEMNRSSPRPFDRISFRPSTPAWPRTSVNHMPWARRLVTKLLPSLGVLVSTGIFI